jgi:hypothetical protein
MVCSPCLELDQAGCIWYVSCQLVDPIGYSLFVRYVDHHFVLILLALSSKTQGAECNDSPQEVFL